MFLPIISPSCGMRLGKSLTRTAALRPPPVTLNVVSVARYGARNFITSRRSSAPAFLSLSSGRRRQLRLVQTSAVKLDLKAQLSQEGRVTVITGGSRGIGLYIGEAIASLGGDVAVLDIIEPNESLELLESRYATKFRFYKTDISVQSQIDASFDQIIADYGAIHNCVTAAGIALDKPFLETTQEDSKKILDINVLGTYFVVQAAVKRMVAQKTGGSIVTIASIAAHRAIPGQRVSIYGASKAAVKLVTKTLAVELAPYNIRVNSISPGFISTDMSKQFVHLEEVFNRVPPAGRIGQRDDLALAVAYLLSPNGAGYTTGSDIPITGGLHGGRIQE